MKTKTVTFKCSEQLFNTLKDSTDNVSRFIIEAIEARLGEQIEPSRLVTTHDLSELRRELLQAIESNAYTTPPAKENESKTSNSSDT